MANTSLAEQLKKLAAPQTSLLIHRKKKPSLLFIPSEAASIDRATFYEIGLGGLNELIELNPVFEEFKNSLFDETSKHFERAIESKDVNEKLNLVIKKFLYNLSPYFLLKPTQKVLEWLIVRFHIHEYNVDELLCSALPYHGTRLFARLIQVLDLKNFNNKWQWLHPLQKKGVPLSKNALFNHCASDVACLKMICKMTVDAVEIFGADASKLTTLFGFFGTTIVGSIQHMSQVTELHLTHMMNSLYYGLSSDCVDFSASVLIIIATLLTKVSFHERMHRKIVEKVTKVNHFSLHNSAILLLNILYQAEKPDQVILPVKAIRNILKNYQWFIPTLADFISSGTYPNIFYLVLVRDSLKLLQAESDNQKVLRTFIYDLLSSCRVNDECAENLITSIINEIKENPDQWCCELVQGLERQYPTAWDNVISKLFMEYPSESLSRVLGLTSITSEVQIFEKLNHVNSVIRIEAIKYVSNNPETVKIKYVRSSLEARWKDDDPEVVKAMFLLPKGLSDCSAEIVDGLLLKCWSSSTNEWSSLLLNIIDFLNKEGDLGKNSAKYTVFLLPFLFSSPELIKSVLLTSSPFFKSLRNKMKSNSTVNYGMLLNSSLPSFQDLINVYEELPKENVYIVAFLLLFSCIYVSSETDDKSEILSFVSEKILSPNFKKIKWKLNRNWQDNLLGQYFIKTKEGKFSREIVYKFFLTVVEHTPIPSQFSSSGWWDFFEDQAALIASLYKHLCMCFRSNEDDGSNLLVTSLLEKHFNTLASKSQFLCNMCLVHKEDSFVTTRTFKLMNSMLRNSDESYSWCLTLKSENVVIPCILIFLYSNDEELRSSVMDTIEIISVSLSSALTSEVTYSELLKNLLKFKSEITIDKEQLLSTIYTFLSQDDDVKSLIPVSVSCFTKNICDGLIESLISEKTPLHVSASLIVVLEYLKDLKVLEKLVEFADGLIKSSNYLNNDASLIVRNIIGKFHANDVTMYKNDKIRRFVVYCLKNGHNIKVRMETDGVTSVVALMLRKFGVNIFDKMDRDLKNVFLNVVFKICSHGDNVDLTSAANSFSKKITLNCEMLVPYLERMKNVGIEKKQKRKSVEIPPDILKSTEWKCGIALLELIQNKKKIHNCHVIMPLLFEVLQKCCELDDQLTVEYAKQVCLSCALNCSQKLISENHRDIEKLFNVELVVSCIRMSPNPQTHHHALLLLAHCATYAPNRVLHNVMAIFTFMGSSILRQDDAFSFQIISNILETIVPLLIKTKDTEELSASSVVSVLKVFASSIPDIPDHRRIPLLIKLTKILENGEYLHVLIILTMESCAKCSVNDRSAGMIYTKVMLELCLLLPVPTVLLCFQKLSIFMNTLPLSIEEKQTGELPFFGTLIDLKKHSKKEFCHFNYIMLNFISSTLAHAKFISLVTRIDIEEFKSLETYFKGIIEQTLLYVRSVTEYGANNKNTPAKYWKAIVSQSLEILNKANALLTNETFLSVVKELLRHQCLTVQRKTLELLNWRLQQSKEDTSKENFSPDELISLISPLIDIISTISRSGDDEAFDQKLNQQIALISLKLITRYCNAFNYPNVFKNILSDLTELWCINEKMNDHVLACMILCIAEFTSALKIHAIESLPKFMPAFLRLFKRFQAGEIAQNDVILLSIITALQKIIEVIPNFLSPYLETILYEVCCLTESINGNDNVDQKKNEDVKPSNVSLKLLLIRQKISSEIPARVLLPSISSCFSELTECSNFNAVKYLLDMLADSFPANGQFSAELTNLFLNILDFRSTSEIDDDVKDLLEGFIIDSLCKIVLKCSETTFRPFYHKLYDWGVIASKDVSKKIRIITYYRLLSIISEKLKSIFVLFASNIMRNAAELLEKYNISKSESDVENAYFDSDEEKTVMLVDSILITLQNVFKYDTIQFLNKERFEMLMEPLVNQVENTIGNYEERSYNIIAPCISRFAAATSDDSLWKQFNYTILLKTRHSSPEVRLTALEIVCLFATQLGDNFLPFLPETVPFLAELLEDENEVVEKKTHKAVQNLEKILDEPIQKYF